MVGWERSRENHGRLKRNRENHGRLERNRQKLGRADLHSGVLNLLSR